MANGYKIIGTKWENVMEIIVDDELSIDNIKEECAPGSMAIVVDEGKIYFMSASGAWAEFGGGAND